MKWIVIAIFACLVPYTAITLYYRKAAPPFRPYEDTKNRVTTARLLSAGYQRITLDAERPADLGRTAVKSSGLATSVTSGGLPAMLTETLIDSPLLPVSIDYVGAAGSVASTQPYSIQFTCSLPDLKQQLAGAHLYLKEDDLYVVPSLEKLGGGLLARTRDSTILLTVPPTTLKPGRYTVTLVGARASRSWTLQVH